MDLIIDVIAFACLSLWLLMVGYFTIRDPRNTIWILTPLMVFMGIAYGVEFFTDSALYARITFSGLSLLVFVPTIWSLVTDSQDDNDVNPDPTDVG